MFTRNAGWRPPTGVTEFTVCLWGAGGAGGGGGAGAGGARGGKAGTDVLGGDGSSGADGNDGNDGNDGGNGGQGGIDVGKAGSQAGAGSQPHLPAATGTPGSS